MSHITEIKRPVNTYEIVKVLDNNECPVWTVIETTPEGVVTGGDHHYIDELDAQYAQLQYTTGAYTHPVKLVDGQLP